MLFDSRKLKETLFGKNAMDEDIELAAEFEPHIRSYVLSNSDSAYICSMAAKTCYGRDVDPYYDQNLKHVEKIMSYGHDSISAHSNIAILITVVSSFNFVYPELINNLDAMKFFNISLLPQAEDPKKDELQYTEFENIKNVKNIYFDRDKILLSGSIRAYRYYVYKMNLVNKKEDLMANSFYNIILDTIYSSIPKEFFPDFIKKGILDGAKFLYHPAVISETEDGHVEVSHQEVIHKDNVDCWYSDNLYELERDLKEELGYAANVEDEDTGKTVADYDKTPKELMTAILDNSIITVKLHDYSRAISQQINRHMSGISQESQRYVNYSSAKFIDPTPFNQDKYEPDHVYNIQLGNTTFRATAKELGQMLISIYPQLEKQGMINQDARSFLPMNVETKAVHTFTWTNFLHFIKLRTDRAAQPEVQNIANQMKEIIESLIENCSDEFKEEIERRMNPMEKDFI